MRVYPCGHTFLNIPIEELIVADRLQRTELRDSLQVTKMLETCPCYSHRKILWFETYRYTATYKHQYDGDLHQYCIGHNAH